MMKAVTGEILKRHGIQHVAEGKLYPIARQRVTMNDEVEVWVVMWFGTVRVPLTWEDYMECPELSSPEIDSPLWGSCVAAQ